MQSSQLKRRKFLTVLGGATALPLTARAQQATMPTIGFLSTGSATSIVPFVDGFRRGLGAAGFAEGRNVTVEYRWADNQHDRLPMLAAELVARPVSVIVTGGATAAALAAKAATSTVPIVFAIGGDPVKFGLVDSMSRPSGNVTGVSFLSNVLVTKQMQLLQALLPPSSVIGVLVNPNNPNAASDTGKAQAAAASLRLQVHIVNAAAERDIDAAFDNLARARSAALLVLPDTLFLGVRERLVGIAVARKLPAIYSNRLYVEDGGLMSYGSIAIDAYREAGIYTGRILRGEKPSDLPVVQSIRFELVINLKTARALGVDLPATLLALADEVIE
jgi:putative tryptophan/tyrosine transport system substrate-binding protein